MLFEIYLNFDMRIYKKKISQLEHNKYGKYSKFAFFPKVLIYVIFLAIKCKSNDKNIINEMKTYQIKIFSPMNQFPWQINVIW